MSHPLNSIDYLRFKRLAEFVMKSGKGEIRPYTSESSEKPGKAYVHIEMSSHEVDFSDVEKAFAIPIEEIMKATL